MYTSRDCASAILIEGASRLTNKTGSTAILGPTLLTTDGQDFKRLVKAGLAWLRHHQAAINILNVYPVPDGDTGTNMVLTMQAAWTRSKTRQSRTWGR